MERKLRKQRKQRARGEETKKETGGKGNRRNRGNTGNKGNRKATEMKPKKHRGSGKYDSQKLLGLLAGIIKLVEGCLRRFSHL